VSKCSFTICRLLISLRSLSNQVKSMSTFMPVYARPARQIDLVKSTQELRSETFIGKILDQVFRCGFPLHAGQSIPGRKHLLYSLWRQNQQWNH
jgi:hypothetical protein